MALYIKRAKRGAKVKKRRTEGKERARGGGEGGEAEKVARSTGP